MRDRTRDSYVNVRHHYYRGLQKLRSFISDGVKGRPPVRGGKCARASDEGLHEHEKYEELCALAVGGALECTELADIHLHLKDCGECRGNYREWSNLITRDLPQTQGAFRQKLSTLRAKSLPDSRQRFLRRARAEGAIFSQQAILTPRRLLVFPSGHTCAGCDVGRSCAEPCGLLSRDATRSLGERDCRDRTASPRIRAIR